MPESPGADVSTTLSSTGIWVPGQSSSNTWAYQTQRLRLAWDKGPQPDEDSGDAGVIWRILMFCQFLLRRRSS